MDACVASNAFGPQKVWRRSSIETGHAVRKRTDYGQRWNPKMFLPHACAFASSIAASLRRQRRGRCEHVRFYRQDLQEVFVSGFARAAFAKWSQCDSHSLLGGPGRSKDFWRLLRAGVDVFSTNSLGSEVKQRLADFPGSQAFYAALRPEVGTCIKQREQITI
eukprot:symbB.v1.2.042670.t1/scaffold10681.1/size1546/1